MTSTKMEAKKDTINNAPEVASVAEHPDSKNNCSELSGLRRVPDKLPLVALLILVVEVRNSQSTIKRVLMVILSSAKGSLISAYRAPFRTTLGLSGSHDKLCK